MPIKKYLLQGVGGGWGGWWGGDRAVSIETAGSLGMWALGGEIGQFQLKLPDLA